MYKMKKWSMKLILFHCASYTIKVAIKPWQAMNFFAKEQVLYEYSVYKVNKKFHQ